MEIPILTKRPDFVAMTTVYSWEYSRYAFRCQNQWLNTMKCSYDMILIVGEQKSRIVQKHTFFAPERYTAGILNTDSLNSAWYETTV